MLSFDVSHLPSRPDDWFGMLDAIVLGTQEDELNELEWKQSLDLSDKSDVFHIARFILATANRDPGASDVFDGYAVMVVGASPGEAKGVRRVDAADLSQRLRPYIGEAIGFDLRYITYRDVDVLIVQVSPSRQGDPIFPLRKEMLKARQGTILRRTDTKSQPANADGIDALSRRARLVNKNVELEVRPRISGPLYGTTWDRDLKREWIERERARLLRAAQPTEPSPEMGPLSALTRQAHTALMWPERRSRTEYQAEIDQYLNEVDHEFDEQAARYLASRGPLLTLEVSNPTPRNLKGVEVTIHIPGEVESFGDKRRRLRSLLPSSPLKWGSDQGLGFHVGPSFYDTLPPTVTRTNGGSTTITVDVGDLRPHQTYTLPPEDGSRLIHTGIPPAVVKATWQATATNHDAMVIGAFEIPTVLEECDETQRLGSEIRLPGEE